VNVAVPTGAAMVNVPSSAVSADSFAPPDPVVTMVIPATGSPASSTATPDSWPSRA
jgi:hypothetical protein